MPESIVGEGFASVFKLIFRFIIEIVFEILIKGLGYLICRVFNRRIDPNGIIVVIVGIVIWALIIWFGYQAIEFVSIDSCLDSGRKYDYELKLCE